MNKICPKCKKDKDEDQYSPSKFKISSGVCKECRKIECKEYYKNSERASNVKQNYYKNTEVLFFEAARSIIHTFNIKSRKEWNIFKKTDRLPENIPPNPSCHYKNSGWKGWGDWLGSNTISTYNKQYRDFDLAREWARGLKIPNEKEWGKFTKSDKFPSDIPMSPQTSKSYKDRWISIADWLDTGRKIYQTDFISFEDCKIFARSQGIKSRQQWMDRFKDNQFSNNNVPSNPSETYKNKGWNGWCDFLGTSLSGLTKRNYLSFDEAKKFVKPLGILSQIEWKEFVKSENRPDNIPKCPWDVFDKEWQGWDDWLGTGKLSLRDKNHKYLIYQIDCLPLNISYIGKTNNIKERTSHYKKGDCHSNIEFENAVKQYGWDNFTVSVIYNELNYDEAFYLEAITILNYKKVGKKLFNIIHYSSKNAERSIKNI